MNKEPKISIITACYNAEKTIEQTIHSVLSQTYDNIEYIIIDGASTDRTMEIVNEYRNQIDIVISESDKGIYDAFNKGIKISTGDYLYFLNSDDLLYNSKVIEEVIGIFAENEAEVIYGNVEYFNEFTGKINLLNKKYDLNLIKQGQMPHHQGTFYSKYIFEKYGYFSLQYKLASDFEFTTRYFNEHNEKISYIDLTIAKFREGGMSTIPTYNKKSWKEEVCEILYEVFTVEKQINPLQNNHDLFKVWVGLLLKDLSITQGIGVTKNIAIFGSGDVAAYLDFDLKRNGLKPVVFIDNNKFKSGKFLNGTLIVSPDKINSYKIDTIILTGEANYDDEIKNQIYSLDESYIGKIKIYSWKELVINTLNISS